MVKKMFMQLSVTVLVIRIHFFNVWDLNLKTLININFKYKACDL